MNKLSDLNNKNNFPVYSVNDGIFRTYGRVVSGFDTGSVTEYLLGCTDIPQEGNIYVASDAGLEALPVIKQISESFYGGMDIQAGYCNGRNSTMNGFEYHKGSEINIAATDMVLMLGHSWDISEKLSYAADWAQVFFVEKGTAIELYQTTLHLSPLKVEDGGFKTAVLLPKGTNTPLTEDEKRAAAKACADGFAEARLLLQKNKWVIAHPQREQLISQGAHPGVLGDNRKLNY